MKTNAVTLRVKKKEVISLNSGDKQVNLLLQTVDASDVGRFKDFDDITFVDAVFVNPREVE